MSIAKIARKKYAEGTESTPDDSGALPSRGSGSEFLLSDGSSSRLACLDPAGTHLEWVPDIEGSIVPEMYAELCRRCPGRTKCLLWACATKSAGYWAGSTTTDRATMTTAGDITSLRADQLQDDALTRLENRPGRRANTLDAQVVLHRLGEGSLTWYRHGCPCSECRSCNTRTRSRERSRARRNAA